MIYTWLCYSKLTLKGTSPVINERHKFSYLKVTGETKMRQNMDMNLNEHWLFLSIISSKPMALLIYGAHKTEKMNAFNKKILRFHRIMVLHKYVVTIFSLLWFWVVAAAHRVVMDSLCVWLCHLSGGSIFFRHHSWCSYLLLIGLNYYCTRSCFYLLSRSSKK